MYYFGFTPSTTLIEHIRTATTLIEQNSDEKLDIHRDKIVHLTSQELLNAMLIKLIDTMPDNSDRKQRLIKLSGHIKTTSDKLIDSLLSPADNEDVLPSFVFFQNHVVKYDNGEMKICFPLADDLALAMLDCFDKVQKGNGKDEVQRLITIFAELSRTCLQHFLVDFTKTLPLNRLKRGAIPLADSVINKAIAVALQHLMPQLPQDSLERFTKHYHSQIFVV